MLLSGLLQSRDGSDLYRGGLWAWLLVNGLLPVGGSRLSLGRSPLYRSWHRIHNGWSNSNEVGATS